jgi:hypothetical protein
LAAFFHALLAQFIERRFAVLQVGGVEAVGESDGDSAIHVELDASAYLLDDRALVRVKQPRAMVTAPPSKGR